MWTPWHYVLYLLYSSLHPLYLPPSPHPRCFLRAVWTLCHDALFLFYSSLHPLYLPPPPPPTSLAVLFLPTFFVAPSPPSENFDQATVSLNYSVQDGESLFLPIKVPICLVHTREILNKNNKCRHTMEYSSFSDLNNSDKVLYLLIRLFLLKKILVICLRIISPSK